MSIKHFCAWIWEEDLSDNHCQQVPSTEAPWRPPRNVMLEIKQTHNIHTLEIRNVGELTCVALRRTGMQEHLAFSNPTPWKKNTQGSPPLIWQLHMKSAATKDAWLYFGAHERCHQARGPCSSKLATTTLGHCNSRWRRRDNIETSSARHSSQSGSSARRWHHCPRQCLSRQAAAHRQHQGRQKKSRSPMHRWQCCLLPTLKLSGNNHNTCSSDSRHVDSTSALIYAPDIDLCCSVSCSTSWGQDYHH